MRAVDPARAENVTFIARHFALPPFLSDVAGRDIENCLPHCLLCTALCAN